MNERIKLEDLKQGTPLFPTDPRLKANCRLWIDHVCPRPFEILLQVNSSYQINTRIVPAFYTTLQNTDPNVQITLSERLQSAIQELIQAADEHVRTPLPSPSLPPSQTNHIILGPLLPRHNPLPRRHPLRPLRPPSLPRARAPAGLAGRDAGHALAAVVGGAGE